MQLLVFRKGFCSKCLQPLGCVISTQSHCSILKFLFVCFVFSFCSFIFPQANLYRACQWGITRKPIMWARQICPALFPLAVILLLVLSIHRFGRRCRAVTDSHVWLGTPVSHAPVRKEDRNRTEKAHRSVSPSLLSLQLPLLGWNNPLIRLWGTSCGPCDRF